MSRRKNLAHLIPDLFGSGPLMIVILVVSAIGLLDAAFLSYIHYYGLQVLPCFGSHSGHSSCETVQSSVWSWFAGVPVAVLGLIGYVALFVSYWATEHWDGEVGRAAGFAVALCGFGFSAYLTYRELFSIHAICEWCVGSAICMAALAVLTAVRYLRGESTTAPNASVRMRW